YRDVTDYDPAAGKHLSVEAVPVLQALIEGLKAVEPWSAEAIHQMILQTAEVHNLKLGKVAQPLRVAMTGGMVSPPIDITLQLIGRERCLKRLNHAIGWIKDQANA
ncbi:MAG: glutamate--tRNA ligase, partial [Peristeroidobacter soli]